MTHTFDTLLAKEYGIIEAILLENIVFWVLKNKANEKHYYEGCYWTYNSNKAFVEQFPYLTSNQIRRALDGLVEKGVLKKGNWSQNQHDRTTWFAVNNDIFDMYQKSQLHLAKNTNGDGEKHKCITDNKPYINNISGLKPQKEKNTLEVYCEKHKEELSKIFDGHLELKEASKKWLRYRWAKKWRYETTDWASLMIKRAKETSTEFIITKIETTIANNVNRDYLYDNEILNFHRQKKENTSNQVKTLTQAEKSKYEDFLKR